MHSFSDLLVTATTGDQPLQRNAAYQCDLTGVHWTDRKVMLRCCTVQVYAEAPRDQRSRAKHILLRHSLPISSSLARTEPDTTRGLCQKQFSRGDLRHRFKRLVKPLGENVPAEYQLVWTIGYKMKLKVAFSSYLERSNNDLNKRQSNSSPFS